MSGNSPWDQWRRGGDEDVVSDEVKRGHALFFGRAGCQQCHLGSNFTDSSFHSLGVGWDTQRATFSDEGRYVVTRQMQDTGAFKTPTLREVIKHPPFMHDGSMGTGKPLEKLHVDLQSMPGLRLFVALPAEPPRPMFLIGREPAQAILAEEAVDGRPGDRHLMEPPEIIGDPAGAEVILLATDIG